MDKALALKEAGLVWKPQIADWFITKSNDALRYVGYIPYEKEDQDRMKEDCIWLPRMDQLLVEIEKRVDEISMFLVSKGRGKWVCRTSVYGEYGPKENYLSADTPEDAAADALLWILQQGDEACLS